jgi:hypothetical protein
MACNSATDLYRLPGLITRSTWICRLLGEVFGQRVIGCYE